MAADVTQDLKPAMVEVTLLAAVPDLEAAERIWATIQHFVTAMPGVYGEGGHVEMMSRAEVVPDSPLDRYIREHGS